MLHANAQSLLLGAASLATYLSDDQLDEINTILISQLQQKGIKPEAVRTYIQTIGAVRSVMTSKVV